MKKMKKILFSIAIITVLLLSAFGQATKADSTATESASVYDLGLNADTKEATQFTIDANNQVYALLDFEDERELENAQRGLIAAPESLIIKDDTGKIVWSQDAYASLSEEAPGSANPSLWRNAQLNHIYGLFEVMEGIYQVRGYDMSNITFIKGNTGWIVYDPLMTVECAQAAYELVKENLGDYPIKAILYSHSHVDHFGGVAGIVSEEQVEKEDILIIAPEGFEEHAVAENIYAGNAMSRRASYQYGALLNGGETGSLSIGIGMGQSKGTTSYISPNTIISKTGQTMTIDGVEMEFQLTPGTEAPAEMNTWFPEKNALWMAENCTGTLHNLYTLRGAEVRDGQAWAGYLMETLKLYGDKAEVVFQAHNWPHWDNANIREYITNTAAVYKFINDQTLFYLNRGYTSTEIANMIELPEELARVWYTRQYYGTVAHNSKAVYQKYMGWYDANPVHLGQLTPTESAKKYVEYLGDVDEVLRKAKEDYDKGEYQWVAELTNVLVFADPDNMDARYLCADALEQLGYQAESGTWRNAYLCAAQELRNGTNTDEATRANSSGGLIDHMTPDMIFQYLGIVTDTMKIQDLSFTANVILPDANYVLIVRNGVIMYEKDAKLEEADATWTTNKLGLYGIVKRNEDAVEKNITQEGDTTLLEKLMSGITEFSDARFFNIIEPKAETAASTEDAMEDNKVANETDKKLWTLAEEAYIFAYPLVLMDMTARTLPTNTLVHASSLANADNKSVVTMNVDTLYTQIIVDIKDEPIILTLPETDRFMEMQIMDAWSNTTAVLDKAGVYAFVKQGDTTELPANVTKVELPTRISWAIGRVVLNGDDDLPNVMKIQDGMDLCPLSVYRSGETHNNAVLAAEAIRTDIVPVQAVAAMNAEEFFGLANELMIDNPPKDADKSEIDKIAGLGVGAGLIFDPTVLNDESGDGWKAMQRKFYTAIAAEAMAFSKKLGIWDYFGEPIGDFGTEYTYRAAVAVSGFGANTTEVAIYPKCVADENGEAFDGKKDYILHFDSFPPVLDKGFWSVTAYGNDDFLIANPLDRYCVNDRSDFQLNDDGSLDILLTANTDTGSEMYVLPTAEEGFHLYMRIYLPDMKALETWNAPTIKLK